jgi:hypothetical protein
MRAFDPQFGVTQPKGSSQAMLPAGGRPGCPASYKKIVCSVSIFLSLIEAKNFCKATGSIRFGGWPETGSFSA